MIKFGHLYILYAGLAVILFTGLYLLSNYLRKKNIRTFGDPGLVAGLIPAMSDWRRLVKFIMLMAAWISIVIGLADPQIGSKLSQNKRQGVELVIALDVSNSMMAEDVVPNRLEAAKLAVEKLVDKLSDDKIGLIVFAGEAYTQLPITADYVSAKMFLNGVRPDMVPVQGTAIGKAIETGIRSFSPQSEESKVLVIISDGENHEDDAVEMSKLAAQKGIVVHTIGMGQPQGAPIPEYGKFGKKDFKTDNTGKVIITKTNDAMLQQIAAAGGGVYVRANNTMGILNKVIEHIDAMNKKVIDSQIYSEYDHQFQYFVGFGILLLFLEFMLLERRNPRFRNFRLFKHQNA